MTDETVDGRGVSPIAGQAIHGEAVAMLDRQAFSARAVWILLTTFVAGSIIVGGLVLSVKLNIGTMDSSIAQQGQRIETQNASIEKLDRRVEGLGERMEKIPEMWAEVKSLRSDLTRLQAEVDRIKGSGGK